MDFIATFLPKEGRPSRYVVTADNYNEAEALATEEYGQRPAVLRPARTEANRRAQVAA